jgi:hypothetical protein
MYSSRGSWRADAPTAVVRGKRDGALTPVMYPPAEKVENKR